MSVPPLARQGDLLVLTVEGPTTTADIQRAFSEALRAATDAALPLLLDVRQGHIPGFSYRDAYTVVDALEEVATDRSTPVAVLDNYDDGFLVTQFFEASSTMRGLRLRSFVSEDEARRWLKAAPDAPAPPDPRSPR